MKLTFLGTRANISHRTPYHRQNAACLVTYRHTKLMIDCGTDWYNKIATIKPTAIIITHAHPDHCAGLRGKVLCPVYAIEASWHLMRSYPIQQAIIIEPYTTMIIGDIQVEAIPVEHAVNAPAVGYRITAGKRSIFYVPDLVFIKKPKRALSKIDVYIGDGARVRYPRVRKHNGHVMGHTSITVQLNWCNKYKVPRALFTHCGTQIVNGDQQLMQQMVACMGRMVGVKAAIAQDGMTITI